MAKRGGFPGGMGMPGNMNNLMKQAQRMQRQMEEGQKELETKEFTAKAGGGAVEVTVSGKKEILNVKLSEEAVDPDDIETLQDMIIAATNEALKLAEEANNELMGKMTGGLGGGFPF
ncbi:MAG: YbaB/EbfC family nucleoid-associated protein [Lachnospiraceae bacterium]|nr:YbaB/EbfC family nucleoid-associated protein [Lachnospiraceae bacterium]MBQ6996115.1 YbaB/EbfC family nucleoid-associated protein [Lachnospiraceae bacterium]